MKADQRPAARDDLFTACSGRDVKKLRAAIDLAVACGLDESLIKQAQDVLQDQEARTALRQRTTRLHPSIDGEDRSPEPGRASPRWDE